MEIGTLYLKLSGSPANVVVKHKITPAELGMYCAMHGEDCVESLVATGIDKDRTINEERARLSNIFVSDVAHKHMAALYPGMSPNYPTTFRAVGHHPESSTPHVSPNDMPVQSSEYNDSEVRKRIAEAAVVRNSTPPTHTAPVHAHELNEQIAPPPVTKFHNDGLSAEMAAPPPPPVE